MLWYGFGAFKTAMSSNIELASAEVLKQGRWKIIATMLAVTAESACLPDTFVVLGSLGGQLDVEPKRWFALGTISASFLWFFGLAILAAAGTAPAHGKITAHYQSGSGMCHVVYSLAAGERRYCSCTSLVQLGAI